MNDAIKLLKRYGRDRDEAAFHEVVRRYFDLVHGVTLRHLRGDAAGALDVAQIVFTDLARKVHGFSDDTLLGGWLHSHTCFVAAKFIRTEMRRTAREKEAAHMNSLEQDSESVWNGLAPILDDALQQLNEPDRSAIILRYFEGDDLRSIGNFLRVSEGTAQKRVQRAVEKLKPLLEVRGVSISIATLAALLLTRATPALAAPPINAVAAKAISGHGVSTVAFEATKIKVLVALIGLVLIIGAIHLYQQLGGPFQASANRPPGQSDDFKNSLAPDANAAAATKIVTTEAGPAHWICRRVFTPDCLVIRKFEIERSLQETTM